MVLYWYCPDRPRFLLTFKYLWNRPDRPTFLLTFKYSVRLSMVLPRSSIKQISSDVRVSMVLPRSPKASYSRLHDTSAFRKMPQAFDTASPTARSMFDKCHLPCEMPLPPCLHAAYAMRVHRRRRSRPPLTASSCDRRRIPAKKPLHAPMRPFAKAHTLCA